MEVTQLPLLEKLYLDNNKLSTLPPELGGLKNLKVLAVDYNLLISVPGKLSTHSAYNIACMCGRVDLGVYVLVDLILS